MFKIVAFICVSFVIDNCTAQNCSPKNFGYNSIVCVCNSTYCDEVPPVPKLAREQYVVYTSSQGGLRFNVKPGKFSEYPTMTTETTVTLDLKKQYQTINGFGSTFSDSAGININSLPQGAQDNLLKSYFSDFGLQYSLCRVPIGGTEFSNWAYSYDDGNEDSQLLNFKLAIEDHLYKIPLIRAAKKLNPDLDLFAYASTAPIWMKHNGRYTGPDVLRADMYQPWTNYFIKFLQAYRNESIEFWGITTGNQPSLGLLPTDISSVGWPPVMMANFIFRSFGPTFRKSDFSSIKLITLGDLIYFFPLYIDRVLFEFHSGIGDYIDGFGLQWDFNKLISYSGLAETHKKYSTKFILGVDASEGTLFSQNGVQLGDWNRAENYASDIINDLENWVTGWVDRNIALNLKGGPSYIKSIQADSTIIVNTFKQEFYKQPMFYALGHFSKFVPKGSVRVGVKQLPSYLDMVAFQKPNKDKVVVMLNRNNFDTSVKVVRGNGKLMSTAVPQKSIVTIVYS